eukprot:g3501.t1
MTKDGEKLEGLRYEQQAKGKLALKNQADERTVLDLKDLSVADRLYLVDQCGVPEEELLEGHEDGLENDYKTPRSLLKKRDDVVFESPTGRVEFRALESENYLILSEGRVDAKDLAEHLEQMWFYQMYRNPVFAKEAGKGKVVLILTESEEFVKELFQWFRGGVTNLSEEQREEVAFYDMAVLRSLPLAKDFYEKENLIRHAYLVRTDKVEIFGKGINHLTAAFSRFLCDVHGLGGVTSAMREKPTYFWYGQGFENEVTFHGGIRTGFSVDGQGAHAWGEPKKWSKDLAKALEKGEVGYGASDFLAGDSSLMPMPLFGEYVTAFALFLRSDMAKEIGTARVIRLTKEQKAMPELTEFLNCYGYSSAEEMEADLLEYIESGDLE